ncbi:MAG: hypothetical protein ABDI20_05290 [Candidatus Bipolaricaulaceae bacterium]
MTAPLLLLALSFAGNVVLAQPEAFVWKIAGDGVEGVYIGSVPDYSQPPRLSELFRCLGFRAVDNWCAPLAAANALVFLDQIAAAEWARGVTSILSPESLSAYLAYFMGTNGEGAGGTGGYRGTQSAMIAVGLEKFATEEGRGLPCPLDKASFSWDVEFVRAVPHTERAFEVYLPSTEKGIPAILTFTYWNPVKGVARELPALDAHGNKVCLALTFYLWGEPLTSTARLRKEDPKVPEEAWDEKGGIGHAVTGVGWLKGDPDGAGPLPETLWLIVHDNWATTAENVAIPWENLLGAVIIKGR